MELGLCLELRVELERYVAADHIRQTISSLSPNMKAESRKQLLDDLQKQASPAWVAKEEDLRFQALKQLVLAKQGKPNVNTGNNS